MDPVTKARTDIQAKDQPKEAVATSQAAQADETIGQDLEGKGYTAETVADKDVTVDAASLCLKSGNATILRGGSEAIYKPTGLVFAN